ncbi:MAG: amidohydrolase family protein, partial [Pyramidobacter sp.]|nr:amidohydrolase family protein [Pyramidobacter sp.]
MSVLFRDVWLLDGSMEKACRADLLVQGEQIARIAAPRTLSGESVEVIDGSAELLVMPGFFNAHCHAAMTLLRGLGEERPLMEWLEQRIWPVEAHLDGDIVYA